MQSYLIGLNLRNSLHGDVKCKLAKGDSLLVVQKKAK